MISKQLLGYIEKEDKLGKSKKEIKKILSSAGWHKDAVSDAFDVYYKKGKKAEVEVEPEEEKSEKPVEVVKENTKPEKDSGKRRLRRPEEPESRPQASGKRRVRPVFSRNFKPCFGCSYHDGYIYIFFNKSEKTTATTAPKETGFEAQKIDDGKRIAEVLAIQKSLEKYYNEHKNYPENINALTNISTASSELNYTYTPIGSPPQSYTLNIEMKNMDDGAFKIDGGFMTLKNKQGAK